MDDGSWLHFPAINLEWINPWMSLDAPRYVDDLLDTMRETGSNALVYCYDSGGRPVYESSLAPKDSHVGQHDLMRLLRDGTRTRGQRLLVGFLGMNNDYVADTHPGWRRRNRDGSPVEWNFRLVCPNSPYADWLARIAGEVVGKYDLDGVYMEGIAGRRCFCSYCQERFRREYGREIPTCTEDELLADEQFTRFRHENTARVYRRVRAAVEKARPGTVLVGVGWFPDAVNLRELARYVDAVSMERQWGYTAGWTALEIPLRELGLHTQIVRAETRRPVYSSMFIDKHVDQDYSPRSPDHIRLNFMSILHKGATVQLHIQNEFEIDRTTLPVVRELYAAELAMRPYLVDAQIVAQAALLHWAGPLDLGPRLASAHPGANLAGEFHERSHRRREARHVPG